MVLEVHKSQVVSIWRWSLAQVWLYLFSTISDTIFSQYAKCGDGSHESLHCMIVVWRLYLMHSCLTSWCFNCSISLNVLAACLIQAKNSGSSRQFGLTFNVIYSVIKLTCPNNGNTDNDLKVLCKSFWNFQTHIKTDEDQFTAKLVSVLTHLCQPSTAGWS